jgi:hypothetical protein
VYTPTGSVCKSTLFDILIKSERLRRALAKISDSQEVKNVLYFKFNLSKLLDHLKSKTMSIYKALNSRYESMQKLPKKQQRQYIQNQEIESSLDQNLLTLASGFIVDELP